MEASRGTKCHRCKGSLLLATREVMMRGLLPITKFSLELSHRHNPMTCFKTRQFDDDDDVIMMAVVLMACTYYPPDRF